ncbi:MAG: hypothetical protein K2O16_05615 [Lachnospiraceae bacterium]|nr:hypothetical protein [Lachnospiraceae bacterium]
MNKPARRGPSPRRDIYTIITLTALIGALIFRIPLGYMIGNRGMACFGMANEIYLAAAGAVSYGLSEAVALLVRYRIKRVQFKSAQKVLRGGLFIGGIIGAALTLLFVFFGHGIAKNVMNLPLAGLCVRLMAPSMVFNILTGVFRGYFKGNGSRVPEMHSQILHTVFLFTGGLIGAGLLVKYGDKVSALLQNADYAGAYGAMGASIGFLTASILCFLHALALFFIFRNNIKRQMGREMQKNTDTNLRIFYLLAGTGSLYMLLWFCFQSLPLIDQYLFFTASKTAGDTAGQWGTYYGKCLVVIGILCAAIDMICLLPIRRILASLERDGQKIAGGKLGILIHQCSVLAIPAAVFLAVLAEDILDLLFKGNNQQAAGWLQLGSLMIVFSVFGAVFMEILLKGRRMKYVAAAGAGAFILHVITAEVLLRTTALGIMAVLIAVIVFYAAVAAAGFFLVSSMFQYRQEWIRTFAITIVAAAISGGIAMLLNRLLVSLLGAGITLLIVVPVCSVIFLILLIVTRAFDAQEMEEMAGGRFLMMLAGFLHR